jgi:hypothetical protein
MRLKKNFLLSSIFILFTIHSYGQINRGYEDWFIGGTIGTTSLWGDLTDNENHFLPGGPFQQGFYEDRKMMWGVTAGKNISPKYGLRAQFLFGKVTSQTYVEKMFMNSTIQDYTASFTFDLIDLFDWSSKSNWDVYGMVGLGFTRFRSQRNSVISNDSIHQPVLDYAPNDSNKFFRNKYSTTISIPFGMGVNYKIGKSLVINAESSIRYLNTDWLDALVSSKRSFEGFGYLSVSVIYRFDMPRGGSVWSRKSNHSFDSQKDNTGASYRTRRHNGSVSSDPFNNRGNKKSSIKGGSRKKRKTFKTPKK